MQVYVSIKHVCVCACVQLFYGSYILLSLAVSQPSEEDEGLPGLNSFLCGEPCLDPMQRKDPRIFSTEVVYTT